MSTQINQNTIDLQSLLDAVNALPEAGGEQATPKITVSSGGLITATAGDKSATMQLSTQSIKTVTPGTSTQTAVDSGRYTTGRVTVAGDSDLIAENIKKGISIFNVVGTFEGGGLPSGVSAFASEEIILPSDVTSTVEVEHNLGVTPNFVAWALCDKNTEEAIAGLSIVGATLRKTVKYSNQSETMYSMLTMIHGYNNTPIMSGTQTRDSKTDAWDETVCTLKASSVYKLRSGYTYRWIACVLDGIL